MCHYARRMGGYRITKYLFSLGHRAVSYVSIPNESGPCTRMEGWSRACREVGAPQFEPIAADWGFSSGRDIGRELGRNDELTAVFGGNDEIAVGIIRGLRDAGRKVPEEVSVVGFDGNPIGEIWDPSLTTISQDFTGAGIAAFKALRQKIEDDRNREHDEELKTIRLPGRLVIRDSAVSRV